MKLILTAFSKSWDMPMLSSKSSSATPRALATALRHSFKHCHNTKSTWKLSANHIQFGWYILKQIIPFTPSLPRCSPYHHSGCCIWTSGPEQFYTHLTKITACNKSPGNTGINCQTQYFQCLVILEWRKKFTSAQWFHLKSLGSKKHIKSNNNLSTN